MLSSQKDKFNVPEGITYLNLATKALMLKTVELAGIHSIHKMATSVHQMKPDDFFSGSWKVRELFSAIIGNTDPQRIAIVPAVSYPMAVVARNLHRKPGIRKGQHILLVGGEFPSDVYAWQRVATELQLTIKTVPMPETSLVGELWNQRILEAIDKDTALVVMANIHWMYGIRFDLEKIGEQARSVGALLAIDGTQSVGALPIDIQKIKPDMLVAVSYKWLLGVYSLGMAYFGEFFDEGIPLEETWMARKDSNQFSKLTDYQYDYQPKAYRYNVGQHSSFITMPMLEASLRQITEWGVANIQDYCKNLVSEPIERLKQIGFAVEDEKYRSNHLFSIRFPAGVDVLKVQQVLAERQIHVSARGTGIRISSHLFNESADFEKLIEALNTVRF
jgi:selenocysteine lyase/cysteine desulfurase